jgi:xanthine dehydrogenase YagR molybdenum-binding subunit
MLYGIVGDRLEQVTRQVPPDEPPPLSENAKLSAIGKSIPRFDAVQKVTGQARYTFDVQLPGMLYARRVVSDVPHARITSIDTSAAETYPGVRAVHVLERTLGSAQLRDWGAEAETRYPTVRYAGQPLAAVAEETPRAAEAAARLVKVVYAPLPHVTTLDEAMQDGAPAVFPGRLTRPQRRAGAARHQACHSGGMCADPTQVAGLAGPVVMSKKAWLRLTSLSTASTAPRSRRMSRWRHMALLPTGARMA